MNGNWTTCGGLAGFDEVPVIVTMYGPAGVPFCDGPPLLVLPPHETMATATPIRQAMESICRDRADSKDGRDLVLKKTLRSHSAKQTPHKAGAHAGLARIGSMSDLEWAVVATVTENA